MWLEEKKDKSGNLRYIYRERYQDPMTGKIKPVSITLNSKSRAARKQAEELLQERINKKLDRAGIIEGRTFKSVMDEWKEHFDMISQKENTKLTYKYAIQDIFEVLPEDVLLSGLTAKLIQGVLDEWYYNRDCSFSLVRNIKTVIAHTLAYAKDNSYIKNTYFMQDVKIKQKPMTAADQERQDEKYLSQDELRTIIQGIQAVNPRIAMMVEFQALTGIRIGELAALRVQDFDQINNRIHITGTSLNCRPGKERQESAKTPFSTRWVSLNKRCIDIINYMIEDNKKLEAWSTPYTDNGFIFTSIHGNPIAVRTVNEAIEKVPGIDKHITSHALRHSHITMLCENKIEVKSIMKRVGHHSPNTTIKIYEHVTDKMQQEVVDTLDTIDLQQQTSASGDAKTDRMAIVK